MGDVYSSVYEISRKYRRNTKSAWTYDSSFKCGFEIDIDTDKRVKFQAAADFGKILIQSFLGSSFKLSRASSGSATF